jgi:hypothetical protein
MGVDLRLFPYYGTGGHVDFSHDVLDVERRRELWTPIGEIEKEHGRDVPENFTTFCGRSDYYDDTCYGVTKDTPYGTPLKYVLAVHLKPLSNHPAVTDNYKNRAVWAFIRECPDDLKIALYWY